MTQWAPLIYSKIIEGSGLQKKSFYMRGQKLILLDCSSLTLPDGGAKLQHTSTLMHKNTGFTPVMTTCLLNMVLRGSNPGFASNLWSLIG